MNVAGICNVTVIIVVIHTEISILHKVLKYNYFSTHFVKIRVYISVGFYALNDQYTSE
jgi:hypothetical protein